MEVRFCLMAASVFTLGLVNSVKKKKNRAEQEKQCEERRCLQSNKLREAANALSVTTWQEGAIGAQTYMETKR